jgi:hypothetical protein
MCIRHSLDRPLFPLGAFFLNEPGDQDNNAEGVTLK